LIKGTQLEWHLNFCNWFCDKLIWIQKASLAKWVVGNTISPDGKEAKNV